MHVDAHVSISIDSKKYEQIINNIKDKAPVEMGVEVVVYMLLFGLLEGSNLVVLDVNSMWKSKAKNYSNAEDIRDFGAVPDLVIVDKAFKFSEDESNKKSYGFIEIKSLACTDIKETGEIESHRKNTNNFIWTNGVIWHYFNQLHPDKNWSVDLKSNINNSRIDIDGLKFIELLYRLRSIEWENK